MPIEIRCPSCAAGFQIPESLADRVVCCWSCGAEIATPSAAPEQIADEPCGREPTRLPEREHRPRDSDDAPRRLPPAVLLGGAACAACVILLLVWLVVFAVVRSRAATQQGQVAGRWEWPAWEFKDPLAEKERFLREHANRNRQRMQELREQEEGQQRALEAKLRWMRDEQERIEAEQRDEPRVGTAVMPKYPTEVKPFAAPDLPDGRLTVPLPGIAVEVVAGGAGRYYLMRMPDGRIHVFDLSETKVHEIKYTEYNPLLAAGLDHFYLLSMRTKTLEKWSFQTMSRVESKAVPVPVELRLVAMALGRASHGPLVITAGEHPHLGETIFYDPVQMALYEMPPSFPKYRFFDASPWCRLRASANGETFVGGPVAGKSSQVYHIHHPLRTPGRISAVQALPDAEGRRIYTDQGVYGLDLRNVAVGVPPGCVPALDGPLVLVPPMEANDRVRIQLADGGRVTDEVEVPNLPADPRDGWEERFAGADRRFHLVSKARTLLVFPRESRILLYRVKVTPG